MEIVHEPQALRRYMRTAVQVSGDNPVLIALLNRITDVNAAFGADERGRVGLLPGVVLTVQSATEIILAPVGAVAEELTR